MRFSRRQLLVGTAAIAVVRITPQLPLVGPPRDFTATELAAWQAASVKQFTLYVERVEKHMITPILDEMLKYMNADVA